MSIYHQPPLLRDQLAYRRHKWFYYAAIAIDPILRFNWIFYVIYAVRRSANLCLPGKNMMLTVQ